MCTSIWLVNEKKHLHDMADVLDHFGAEKVIVKGGYPVASYLGRDCCTCPIDIQSTAVASGYEIVEHDGDPMRYHLKKSN